MKKRTKNKTDKPKSAKNGKEKSSVRKTTQVKRKPTEKSSSKSLLNKLEKEISKRQIFQKQLIENEERYRILSQITSDYMFSASIEKDKSIVLDWASTRFELEIGYPLENLFNFRHIRRYFFLDDLHDIIPIRNKLIKGENVEREIRIFNSDGELVWINAKLFPVYDKKKRRVTKFYCAASNITQKKKSEIAIHQLNNELELRVEERTAQLEDAVNNLKHQIEVRAEIEKKLINSENKLKEIIETLDAKLQESEYKHLWNVFENSEIPTLTFNEDGKILNYNFSFEKLTGYKQSELETIDNFSKLLFEKEERSKFNNSLLSTVNNSIENVSREYSIITKSKTTKEILGLINKLYHEGEETGIKIIQFLDITETKKITSIINTISENVFSKSGQKFFDSLVVSIAKSIEADFVFIGTEDKNNPSIINTLSVFGEGKLLDNFSYELEGTPSENVFGKQVCIYNKNCVKLFPEDRMLSDLNIEAYVGIPLFDTYNNPIGLLVALKKSPFENEEFIKKILSIYSSRAADEIEINKTIQALKASESKFFKAFHTSPDSININRLKDGLYIDVNQGFYDLTGYSKDEVIGRTSRDINIWYNSDERTKLVKLLLTQGIVSNFKAQFRMKDGKVKYGLMSASLIDINNEKFTISITRDISDLVEKEKQLKESEERYRVLIETSPFAHIVHIDGVVLYANEASRKMFKAPTINDVIGKNLFDYLHPHYANFAKNRLEQIKMGANNLPSAEIKFICFDGSTIDIEVTARAFNYKGKNAILVVANDITEKKLVQNRLKETELRYKKLFDLSPEALYLVYEEKILLANKSFLSLIGLSNFEELRDKKLIDFVHPECKELYEQRKNELKKKDFLPFTEYKLIKAGGSVVYAEIATTKINLEGKVVFQSVARNITEKKITEAALKESQERYKLIIDNSPYAYAIHQNGKLIYANPATLKLINANSLDEIIGKPVLDFVHPEYKQIAIKRIQEGAKTLQILPPLEEKLLSLDGKEFIAEITSIPFYLNGILSFQLIINDVTKIKAANEQLTMLSNALEQSSSGILISDVDGKIEYVNKKFEEITGYELKDIVGQTPRILKSGKQDLAFYQNLWNTILSGNNYRAELLNKKKSGELYWELNLISSIKNAEGKITHFVAVKEDITEQKKIEFELRKAKEEAEEAAKVRTHLLANMSHEFRTPLGSIIGYSSILKDEAENDETRRMARQIEVSANRLMKTFNELITLTELETDEFAINPVEVDLPFFCSQLRILYETMALSKGLEIKAQLATEELTTFIDESILTKIVGYIIDNAIKFTEKGEITIELENPFTKNDKQFAVISIQDTGKGIQEDELEIIFKEFRQISEGIRRDFEGLGLGLTLASRLARLIDIEISVISEFGKGSKFSLTIPIKTEQQISEEVAQKITKKTFDETLPTKENIDILVVEDNPLNIDILQKVLAKIGKIVTARDGKTAIKIAEEKKFDIMLIDINLGYGIDGIEVLNQIRNFDHHKNTPAIALTAYASEMSKREFLQKGFSDFISKPFEKKALIDLVENLGKKSS